MPYEALLDLLNYVGAIGPAWLGVVGTSVPFVVNEMLGRSAQYRKWASKLAHPAVRRVALFALLLLSVFWAGFLTWREEHAAKEAISQKYNDLITKGKTLSNHGARLQFYGFEQGMVEGENGYNLKISNIGPSPAYIDAFRARIIISDHRLAADDCSAIMADLEKQIKETKPDDSRALELNTNQYQSYGFLARDPNGIFMPSNRDHSELNSGKLFMQIMAVASFKDESILLNNQRKIMRYCGLAVNGGPTSIICPGQNKTFIENYLAN